MSNVTALRTRKPSGVPPWPLILLEGAEKVGKTWMALEFSGDQRIHQTWALDLGEGSLDEYGAIPGADFDILEHDGTWAEIIGQIEAAVEESKKLRADGRVPMLVVDSGSAEWDMLKSWVDVRARRQPSNIRKLRENPDNEIKASRNIWNDADARHQRFMRLLRAFDGPVILTARGKWVSATGKDGQPLQGEKEYRVEAQKNVGYAANAWVRLSRDEPPTVIGLRGVKHGIRPGIDDVRPWRDFTLGALIFDVIGCEQETTTVRVQADLDADQVLPDEELAPLEDDAAPTGARTAPTGPRPVRTPAQNAAYAKAGLAKLLAAGTVVAATELHQKAKSDPVGTVLVYEDIGEERREILGITPEQAGITLADLGYLVVAYVERRGMSVDAALDAVNGGGAVAS